MYNYCWFKEDKSRVEILKEYAKQMKESVWTPFMHLLNRNDRFIVNQVQTHHASSSWFIYMYLLIFFTSQVSDSLTFTSQGDEIKRTRHLASKDAA